MTAVVCFLCMVPEHIVNGIDVFVIPHLFARWIQRELIADSMRVSGKRGRERIELWLFCVAGWNNVRSWFAVRESRCYATLSLKFGGTEAGEAILGRRLR